MKGTTAKELRSRSVSALKTAARKASGIGEKAATWLFTEPSPAVSLVPKPTNAHPKLDEVDPATGRSRREEALLASSHFNIATAVDLGVTLWPDTGGRRFKPGCPRVVCCT